MSQINPTAIIDVTSTNSTSDWRRSVRRSGKFRISVRQRATRTTLTLNTHSPPPLTPTSPTTPSTSPPPPPPPAANGLS